MYNVHCTNKHVTNTKFFTHTYASEFFWNVRICNKNEIEGGREGKKSWALYEVCVKYANTITAKCLKKGTNVLVCCHVMLNNILLEYIFD